MEPFLLQPACKDYLWGGTRLKTEYNKQCDLVPLAETWECSIHPDGPSVVRNGEFKGQSLSDVLKVHPEFIGEKAEGIFSILVKLIDAKQNLSVQVHPGDAYAREHEGDNGKTEMWYVLDADDGAQLVSGFAHNVTAKQLRESINDGNLSKHLQKVSVHKGDVFFIPAGTIHAIGGGIMIAEIQESSNITYRVYDYDRKDRDGNRRPLHFDKAIDVLDIKKADEVRQKPRLIRYFPGCAREILCRCQYFETERIQISMATSFSVRETSFQVILCLEGCGGIETGNSYKPLRFKKGDCVFLPAGIGRCHVVGNLELLKIRC